MARLSRRNKRALLILGGVVSITLGVSYVILPFLDAREQIGQQIQQEERRLQSAHRLLRNQENAAGQLQTLDSVLSQFESQLLDARDVNAAAVEVEETARALANEYGVRVTRSNPLPDRKIGEKFAKVGIQLQLESDLDGLISFMHAISTHPRFIVVEEFNIASFRVRDETRIQPRMQISAFIRLS